MVAPPFDVSLLDLLYGYRLNIYWNVLGMPAGVVPSSQVNIDETTYNDEIRDNFEYYARMCMKDSAGLPTAVQIVG